MIAIAVAVTVVACGAETSHLDSSAAVELKGQIQQPDGSPASNVRVVLVREAGVGETLLGLFETAASIGLACLSDNGPSICRSNAHFATTGSDGNFSFGLTGKDTQDPFGRAGTMALSSRLPAGPGEVHGPAVTAEFSVQANSLTLPALRLWRPESKVSVDSRTAAITWPGLPKRDYGSLDNYSLHFHEASGRPFWAVSNAASGKGFDARVLENSNGEAWVSARAHGTASGSNITYTYDATSLAYRGMAGVPPFHQDVRVDGSACGPQPASPCTSSGQAMVDLGSTRPLSLVVLRDCFGRCTIETSADQNAWKLAASTQDQFAAVGVSPATSGRYLRLTSSAPGLNVRLSVW